MKISKILKKSKKSIKKKQKKNKEKNLSKKKAIILVFSILGGPHSKDKGGTEFLCLIFDARPELSTPAHFRSQGG